MHTLKDLVLISLVVLIMTIIYSPISAHAADLTNDSDHDGLTDQAEIKSYYTDPFNADTDGDSYSDGVEVHSSYDPRNPLREKLKKIITISLATQQLTYALGPYTLGTFAISSGLPGTPTPVGIFSLLEKKPFVRYIGTGYDFPHTKWNLKFKKDGYYIHGAYWHTNFGKPESHGCVNVSYSNMQNLYNWADKYTIIHIANSQVITKIN